MMDVLRDKRLKLDQFHYNNKKDNLFTLDANG